MDREMPENDKTTEVSPATRRAILLGGAAGLAGLVADSVMSAQPASAAQGGNVLIGKDNTGATARTAVFVPGGTVVGVLADEANLYGVQGQDNSSGGGTGVYRQSINGTGVYGSGSKSGVFGSGGIYGIFGSGGACGVFGTDGGSAAAIPVAAFLFNRANASPAVQATTAGTGNAVFGSITNVANTQPAILGSTKGTGPGVKGGSTNAAGIGVLGQGTTGAIGVEGASDTGTGVLAKSTSGDALKVVGKIAFSRSGLVTIGATKKSLRVNLAGVTTSSMVIATLQTAAGAIGVANAVPGTGSFTINLTAAPTGAVKVAWFVIG